MPATDAIFTNLGGTFCISPATFSEKLKSIRAFIFDWDGVFNNGTKNELGSSSFNEIDAMGTNMLRFSYYLDKGQLPYAAVMSGEKNVLSFRYGIREHFHHVYFGVKNKKMAFEHFTAMHALDPHEVAFVFDDVLDLSLAEVCGVRILINRTANPLFEKYVTDNQLTDYITAHSGGDFAVREACELLIGIRGNYDTTIHHRAHFSDTYNNYFTLRQQLPTTFFTWKNNAISRTETPE